jgi:hypothetical protein
MFVPYRRHLQLDDHAAQGFDRASCAYAPVPDKGDRLALPLDQGAVECVLEDRRGIVIVFADTPVQWLVEDASARPDLRRIIGCRLAMHIILPHMTARRGGAIVSIGARQPFRLTGLGAYTAAKARAVLKIQRGRHVSCYGHS